MFSRAMTARFRSAGCMGCRRCQPARRTSLFVVLRPIARHVGCLCRIRLWCWTDVVNAAGITCCVGTDDRSGAHHRLYIEPGAVTRISTQFVMSRFRCGTGLSTAGGQSARRSPAIWSDGATSRCPFVPAVLGYTTDTGDGVPSAAEAAWSGAVAGGPASTMQTFVPLGTSAWARGMLSVVFARPPC